MNRRIALTLVLVALFLTACNEPLAGNWKLHMQGTVENGEGAADCGSEMDIEMEFAVAQEGDQFSAVAGPSEGFSMSGTQSKSGDLEFQVLVFPTDGCADTTNFKGTDTGGTFEGTDCNGGTVCSWSGNYTLAIFPDN